MRIQNKVQGFGRGGRLTICLLLLVLAAAQNLIAAIGWSETAPLFINMQLENDLFATGGDRFYTNGTEISVFIPGKVPTVLEQLADLFPLYERSDREGAKYSVGQLIFTPEDISSPYLLKDDRPYAGYMFATAAIASQFMESDVVAWGNMLEVTVGIIGPDAHGAETQTWVHEQIDSEIPQGWDNQLHNELGLGLSYTRMWGFKQNVTENTQAVISTHMTAMAGNIYTYCGGGAMFRWGRNAQSAIAPPSISPAFPGLPAFDDSSIFSWYVFIGFESRFMFWNIFLDGNILEDSPSVSKEFVVGDQMYGLAFQYRSFRCALTTLRRTKEFTEQKDGSRYGAITLTWRI